MEEDARHTNEVSRCSSTHTLIATMRFYWLTRYLGETATPTVNQSPKTVVNAKSFNGFNGKALDSDCSSGSAKDCTMPGKPGQTLHCEHLAWHHRLCRS